MMISPEALYGIWDLRAVGAVNLKNEKLPSIYGREQPSGYIHYHPLGRMIVIITHGGRSNLTGDRAIAPINERAVAFASCIAYSGRFEIDGNRVRHMIDCCTYPNWVGTTLIRKALLDESNEVLTLETVPQMHNGEPIIISLIWHKMRFDNASELQNTVVNELI